MRFEDGGACAGCSHVVAGKASWDSGWGSTRVSGLEGGWCRMGRDVALGGIPFEMASVARSSEWQAVPGLALRTCSAEDLVVHKVFLGRAQDWANVEKVQPRQVRRLNVAPIQGELAPLPALKSGESSMPSSISSSPSKPSSQASSCWSCRSPASSACIAAPAAAAAAWSAAADADTSIAASSEHVHVHASMELDGRACLEAAWQ